MQSFYTNRLLYARRLLHHFGRHALICDFMHISSLSLQYHYVSMQMNDMPIDSMFRNEKNP